MFTSDHDNTVIRISHKVQSSLASISLSSSFSMIFANSGERFPPCGVPTIESSYSSSIMIPLTRYFLTTRDNISIFNCSSNNRHQFVMIYCVKELFQVNVYNPVITIIHHIECCQDCLLCTSIRSESITMVMKLLLIDWC